MSKLTQKQADALAFIKSFRSEKGFSPTRQEIADNFGIQVTSAQVRVIALIKKGALTEVKRSFRSIIPVKGFRVRIKAT